MSDDHTTYLALAMRTVFRALSVGGYVGERGMGERDVWEGVGGEGVWGRGECGRVCGGEGSVGGCVGEWGVWEGAWGRGCVGGCVGERGVWEGVWGGEGCVKNTRYATIV